MKPIRLEIQGLHSFREPQEVDFTALAGGGLFGIFGPTGSGKSTILDAMLLALYGKVYRAASDHNRGILNQYETKCRVALTFESAGTRFRVERVYNADKKREFGVRAGVCRLVEETPGLERVVEDQTRRLDAKVQEITGLEYDDFTRAVVLPQGQFAQFLLLENASRRDMLERIFALGDYGRRLNRVVAGHREQAESTLGAVKLFLAGLGDASPVALVAAEESFRGAEAARRLNQTGKEAAERELAEKTLVAEAQAQLRSTREAVQALEDRREEIVEVERRLGRGGRAEGLRSNLEAAGAAESALRASQAGYRNAEEAAGQAKQAFEQAQTVHEAAWKRKETGEPDLLRREEQLKQASDLERTVATAGKERAALSTTIGSLEAARADLEARLRQQEAAGEADEGALAWARERLAGARVAAEERDRVIRAAAAWEAWREARGARDGAGEAEAAKAAALGEAEGVWRVAVGALGEAGEAARAAGADLEQWGLARPAAEDEEATRGRELERLRGEVRELERAAVEVAAAAVEVGARETAWQGATEGEEAARRLWEEAKGDSAALKEAVAGAEEEQRHLKTVHLAVSLAADLAEGQPCPVCGATRHPQPAAGDGGTEEVLAAAGERVAAARRELDTAMEVEAAANAALSARQGELEAARASLEAARRELGRRREGEESLRAGWPEARRGLALEELGTRLGGLEGELESFRAAFREWNEGLGARQDKAREAEVGAQEAALAEGRAKAVLEAAQGAFAEAQEAVRKAEEAAAGKRSTWDASRGELDETSLPERRAEIAALDQAAEKLQGRIDTLTEGIELCRREMAAEAKDLERILRELAVLEERRKALDAGIQEKTEVRDRLAGGRPVAEVSAEVVRALTDIRAAFEAAKESWEEAKEKSGAAERDLANAAGQREAAADGLTKAAGVLAAGLVKAGFGDREEALAALLEPEERGELEKRLADFTTERTRLANEEARLVELLAGRSVEANDLAATRERTTAAVAAYEGALVAEGQAGGFLAGLRQKADEWAALNEQHRSLNVHLGRLSQLARWLEGNALVEFLATEQLEALAHSASQRLNRLTHGRLALEVGDKGEFLIRDILTGKLRPVRQLSGGETFLVSLALSIALSTQIQLRGTNRLQFFFLDEGFGSLDPATLDTAMDALGRLHLEDMTIGVISHVPEVRHRIQRRLIVDPAEAWGRGSRLRVEYA